MSEQVGLPGAQKSLALLEKLKRRVNGAAAAEIPVAPATTSTRSGRVPGVRGAGSLPTAPLPAPSAALPTAPLPAAPLPAAPLPAAPQAQRMANKPAPPRPAEPALLAPAPPLPDRPAAPVSVQARLGAVNWERKPLVTARPAEAAASSGGQQRWLPVTVQARMNAVNWERKPLHDPEPAPPKLVTPRPEPVSTVESFFSDIQW
jgi:hypothetical protein